MNFPLSEFEQYINETILKRGLSYFKKGNVKEVREIQAGIYEASVSGNEDYRVRLELRQRMVTRHSCTCPYDQGPVCKHVCAVIFFLEKDRLGLSPSPGTKQKAAAGKTKKSGSSAIAIEEVLKHAPEEDIRKFILETAKHDKHFKFRFLNAFAHYTEKDSKSFYVSQLKAILRSASGRHGFIDWRAARQVGNAVYELLEQAQKRIDNRQYTGAMIIATAVLEQMTKALDHADDSNGDIGGLIFTANDILYQLVENASDKSFRKELFNYCLKAFKKEAFDGWDWHIGMLRVAMPLIATTKEAEEFLRTIDEAELSEFEAERVQAIRFTLLLSLDRKEEAEHYLQQNLGNPELRGIAIEKALEENRPEEAIRIAREGIACDQHNKPGLVNRWKEWLLRIAQEQQDIPAVINYARQLLMNSSNPEQDHYQILKENLPADQHEAFIDDLLKEMAAERSWSSERKMTRIYIREEMWDRLLEYVRKQSHLNTLQQFEEYLAPVYPEELVQLYGSAIRLYLENNVSRNHYRQACRFIRRMLKLEGYEAVDKLVSELREKYPQRRALMEELDQV